MKHLLIILLSLYFVGCSSDPVMVTSAPVPSKAEDNISEQKTPETHPVAKETAQKETPAASPVLGLAEKVTESVKKTHKPDGVEPTTALGWLKNGNTRFVKHYLRKDGVSKKDIDRLAQGQHPHSVVLSCSDSRVPPEIVFDQKLGEIFVVRTAGEAIEPTAIASIEYAVEHLGARNILVLGHTQCGAVKAALSTLGGKDAGSPNLNKLVADIHPRLKAFNNTSPSKNYSEEGWSNAKGVALDLLARSELLAEMVKSGDIKISSALYNLHSGIVDFE